MYNLLRHAFAYALAAVVQKGLGFVVFLWLAATLSVEQYAKFGLFFAFQTGIATLVGAGVFESVIGRLKDYPRDENQRSVLGAGSGTFIVKAALVLVLTMVLGGWFKRWIAASAVDIGVLALIGILSGFFLLQAQLVRLEERHTASLLLNNVPMFVAFLAGGACFLMFRTVTSFFAGMALGFGASFPAFFSVCAGLRDAFAKPALMFSIGLHMVPFAVIAITSWLSGYGSTYLIHSFFNASDVSRFAFAYTIASVLQLVATSLNQVWSPRFFRIIHTTPHVEMEKQSHFFFTIEGVILGVVGGAILLLAPSAINLAGERLHAYSNLSFGIFLLLAGYAASIPWYHAQNYYFAHGYGGNIMTAILAASAAGLVMWFTAIWYLGAIGAYLGFTTQMLSRSFVVVMMARRKWRVGVLWQGPAIALLLLVLGGVLGDPLSSILGLS